MTQEEKMKRLLDAQDNPEAFTEEELQAMLAEDDLRESAELQAKLKQAYIGEETEEIDVEEEWLKFLENEELRMKSEEFLTPEGMSEQARRSTAHPTAKSHSSFQKIAASFIGLLMLSGIAYAAIHIVSNSRSQQVEVQDTTARNQGDRSLDSEQNHGPVPLIPEPKTFENVPLKDIAAELAKVYHVTIEVKNAETAALRLYYPWNPQMPLQQVVEELNRFEKVHLTLTNDTLIIE